MSRRTSRLRLLDLLGALVFALGVTGCALGPNPLPVPDGPITDLQRADAMLSIHAHAYRPDRDFGDARFMDFGEAIGVLLEDRGQGADSRVRRAIAKLWSHAHGRPDFQLAIEKLLRKYGISFNDFDMAVQQAADGLAPAIVLPPSPDQQRLFEITIVNLPILVGITKDCPYDVPPVEGNVKPIPHVGWDYTAKIPRPVHDIARALDPQSWSKTNKFFRASYLIDAPSCCSKGGACTYATVTNTKDPMKGTEFPAGQPYGERPLFESICTGGQCGQCEGPPRCEIAFKNILCVRADYDIYTPFSCLARHAGEYSVGYRFKTPIFGELNGTEGHEVNADAGSLSVWPATPQQKMGLPGNVWSVVNVTKGMSFKDPNTTLDASVVLQSYNDELRDQVVEQACHLIPEAHWCYLTKP